MIASEMEADVKQVVEQLFAQKPDWVTFYREVFGLRGVIRQTYPTRETLAAFEKTEAYQDILRMLAKLRQDGPSALDTDDPEPTRVITVRLPKSMHESLKVEAHEHRTTMNKLCISKLIQFIDGQNVPVEQ